MDKYKHYTTKILNKVNKKTNVVSDRDAVNTISNNPRKLWSLLTLN